ncbi:hypothetical protein [Gordonia shandongensis]|uniref:hypothetical protein n=1 Tax=Gordonia shandongensis TaxID=376351 RepID=UPI00040D6A5E|nr:hypothetical protein [Gordonia shandongensis]
MATSAVAGAAGIALIVGSVGVWRTTDELGLSGLRIAGTGAYGFEQTLATHPIGWVLIGLGLMLLVAAGAAWFRPMWSGVATATLGIAALIGVLVLGWLLPERMMFDTVQQIGADQAFVDLLGPGWGLILSTAAAATATLGGAVSVVLVEPHRRARPLLIGIVGGAVLGVVAVIIGSWAPDGAEIRIVG